VRMQETAIETFREIIVKESHQISEFRILIDMRSTGESRQSSPDNITVGIGSDMSEETRETGQELIDGKKKHSRSRKNFVNPDHNPECEW
jgi:hypothetical protein